MLKMNPLFELRNRSVNLGIKFIAGIPVFIDLLKPQTATRSFYQQATKSLRTVKLNEYTYSWRCKIQSS